jgi:hypothetical protein
MGTEIHIAPGFSTRALCGTKVRTEFGNPIKDTCAAASVSAAMDMIEFGAHPDRKRAVVFTICPACGVSK